MKRKVIGVLLAAVMTASLVACGGSGGGTAPAPAASSAPAEASAPAAEASTAAAEVSTAAAETSAPAETPSGASGDLAILDGKKLGITIQSLQNAYWAGVMSALEDLLKANGASPTIVACDDNSATQIGQIENFISSGCDLIMVHPSDANAVEDVCKQAMDAGIRVMCWDDPMENTDADWVLDNTELGKAIGEMAADFINEHYSEDNKAEVAVIGYPQTQVLLERANGIKAGLEEGAAGKYEIVAEQTGIEAPEAQTSMETILQAHPDCKVVAGVGAGAMIGTNEALMTYYNSQIPEDCGVFTTDVTKQQLENLLGDTACKGIIGFEGSDEDTALACATMYARILNGEFESGDRIVYRGIGRITPADAERVLSQMR